MLARVLQPGTVLHDRYHILRPIGKGGMGAVYEAIDLRLHNTVAVKHTTAEGPGIDQAFEREAQLLAALRHPALPVVIDYFVETQGRFLVMQYIDGEDLAALLKRGGPRNEADVEHWAVVVLQALKYLHGHNPPIIHRDIKPANLKLTPRGEILLLDFGLAKGRADQRTVAAEEELSVYGYTPHYAPLEQIEGRGTDARSDIYALGATLYHLISGTAPPGAIDRAKAVASGGADPLIAGLPQLLLDSGLRATILRALALDPAGRFSSAEEMAAAFVLDVPSPGAGSTYSQVTESRRLDAAMPSQAEVGRVVDLIVQVRFRDSPLLGLEEWPSIRTPDEIEQRSEPLHVDYPIDPRSGRKLPARLRVRLAAPDFEIQGSDERLIDVPPDAYSARLAFLLAPQRAGFCRVNVEVYAADTVFLGTIPIEAEAFTRGIKGSVIRVANLMIGVFIQPAASVRVVLSREQDKENAPSFSPDVASARERERPAELAYSELSRKQQEPVGVGSDGHAAWHDSSENLDREDTATVLAAPPTSAASAPSKTRRRVGRPFRLASLVGALATLTIWYARGAPVAPVESISLTPDALTEDATDARLAAAAKVAREEAQAKAESDAAKLDVRAITAARAQADARAASQAKVDADARAAAQAKADADARAAAQAKADADARAAAEAEADARAEMAARDAQASSEHHQQDFQVPQQHQQQQQPQPEHNNVQQSQQHSNFQQPQQQGGGNHFQSPQQQQHGNSQQQGQGGGFHFQSPQQAQSGHQGNNAGQGSHGGFQSPQQAQSGHQGNYAAQGGHNGFQSPTSGDGAKAAGYAHDNQPGRDADTAGHDRENERGRGNDAGHGRENAPGQQKNAQAQKPQRTERQLAMKNGMQSKVQVDNRGRARAIQARDSKGDQLQVRNGLRRGDRTVEKRGADNQRIVSTGRGRGFTERSYSVNNKYRENVKYVQRTYVSENVTNVYAYRSAVWNGDPYYVYAPTYYYRPAYYEWAADPWAVPVQYTWGWQDPWYGYYGGYFTPAPVYPTASLWLTDYLLAQSLQAAYAAQAAAAAGPVDPGYADQGGSADQGGYADQGGGDQYAQQGSNDQYAGDRGDNAPKPAAAPKPKPAPAAVALSPEVKQMIATEVEAEIKKTQAAATQPDGGGVAWGSSDKPPALDPTLQVFVVSDTLTVSMSDGNECDLTAGDVLYRVEDDPDGDNTLGMKVTASKGTDCAVSSKPRVQVADLQEMHNHFREQLDGGLKTLAAGGKGLPPAPDTATVQGEVAPPTPDTGATAEVNHVHDEGDSVDTDVQQAAAQLEVPQPVKPTAAVGMAR